MEILVYISFLQTFRYIMNEEEKTLVNVIKSTNNYVIVHIY